MTLSTCSSLSSTSPISSSLSPSSASHSSLSTLSSTMSPPLLPPISVLSGRSSTLATGPSIPILPKAGLVTGLPYDFSTYASQQEMWNTLSTNRPQSNIGPDLKVGVSSDKLLAEKRRRNAGASARFRDRRKQREHELQERCSVLEKRIKELEASLEACTSSSQSSKDITIPEHGSVSPSMDSSLGDRVGQLERIMIHFQNERAADSHKMKQLEKENVYLKSLLQDKKDSAK